MFHLKNHFLAVCIYLWVCGLCVLPAFGQADPGGALPVPGGNFLRSEVSAALDNPSLQFTLRDPDYWTVSHDHFQIGGSSMYVDLGFPDDPPLWSTILEAEISGPALLSYWVYLERVNIAHTFGEIDPDPDNHQGLKWDGDLPSTNVASFGDSSLTWVRVNFAIPGGTYQVGWRFGGWFVGGAAYLDQVMLMSLEGDWGYMVNPDGNTVTVHTFLTEPRQSWEEPVPIALNIPATLGGKPVTAIGEAAFSNMFLSELSLPNTLTTIGAGAFRGCHGVTEVTVPASVTTLGADVWAEFDGLKYVIFTGARPAASAEALGSQAYILYPAGQAGWVDGGTYRGLTTLAWSGTRVPEPQFGREANSNPEAFYYFNKAFTLTMATQPGLQIRYALGGAVPTTAQPGSLYQQPLELDHATDDIEVCARVFRGGQAASGVMRGIFQNAKYLSEILGCFDAIFVMPDPEQWQIMDELDGQGNVIGRYLQAGPFLENKVAQLKMYMYYEQVPDLFNFEWRLVSTKPEPSSSSLNAGYFTLQLSGIDDRFVSGHRANWETYPISITQGGLVAGLLSYDNSWIVPKETGYFLLRKLRVMAPKIIPTITLEPPGSGSIFYRLQGQTDWAPFLGTEQVPANTQMQLKAEPIDGYMFISWKRHNNVNDTYEAAGTGTQQYFHIYEEDAGFPLDNDFRAEFVEAVMVRVNVGEGGAWPTKANYAQSAYAGVGKQAPKGSTLKFLPSPLSGYRFVSWSDGVLEQDRTIVCDHDIDLQANFEKSIKSTPAISCLNVSPPPTDVFFTSGVGDFPDLDVNGRVTFTITPVLPEHYRFESWQISQPVVSQQTNGMSLTVTLDWNQVKFFTPTLRFYRQTRVQLRIAAGQENRGLLDVHVGGADGATVVLDQDGFGKVDIAKSLWFTAIPLGGSRFERWHIRYQITAESTMVDLSYTTPERSLYIYDYFLFEATAYFVSQAPLYLDCDPGGNGTGTFKVNGQPYTVNGSFFDLGQQVWLQAVPDVNNRFGQWVDTQSTSIGRYVYIVPGENRYVAQFVKTGTVTLKAELHHNGAAGGGVTKVYYPDLGSDLTLTATPYSGHRFMHWQDNGSTDPVRVVTNVGVQNLEFTAIYGLVINVSASAPNGGGSFTGTGQRDLEAFPIEVTAHPYGNYRFDRWLDDESAPITRQLTVDDIVNNRISLQARFIRFYNITIQPSTNQQELGAVVITDAGGAHFDYNGATGAYTANVDAGSKISYQAVPAEGCDFVRWSWNGSTEPIVTELVIDASRSITAVFARRATINLSVKEGQENWGGVSMTYDGAPAESGPHFHVGKWVRVEAAPKANARFVRWSDGATAAVRNVQVTVGTTNLVAEFVRTASVKVELTSDTPDEAPTTMRWGFPWSPWQLPGGTYVFDVESDEGRECKLQFYGQYGWDLPMEQNEVLVVLPQQNLELSVQYRKITTGTLVGWLNPNNIGGQWRVKPNPQTDYLGSGWFDNGANVVLEQGTYEIDFKEILDGDGHESWHQPEVLHLDQGPSATVTVTANQRQNFTGKYRKYVPELRLSFSPGEASEGAGPSASIATLQRVPREVGEEIDRSEAITVRFTASEANALIFPSSITIPAGRERVQFTIGVIDNDLREQTEIVAADGETVLGRGRVIALNGLVSLPSSCNCDGNPSSGAEITAELAIYDNDGPSLQVTVNPSTLQEPEPGSARKLYPGALTIRRNDRSGEGLPAIDVALSALVNGVPNDSELEFQVAGLPVTEVTIPAGALSITVDLATVDDEIEDGNQLVSIYADTEAAPPDEPGVKYAPGSCWVMVSDLSFPDYVVSFLATPDEPLAGGSEYELELTIINQGRLAMTGGIPLAIHASANNILGEQTKILETSYLGGLAVGQSAHLRLQVPLEMAPGAKWRFAAVVNPKNTLREVSLLNNTTWSEEFTVQASYRAMAQVDDVTKTTSLMGEGVLLSGQTLRLDSDVAVPNVDADVYVIVNGIRRVLAVTSDDAGQFTVLFMPLAGEAGHVELGACYPGLGSSQPQDEFDILGVRFVKSTCGEFTATSYIQWGVTVNDLNGATLQLNNRSPIALTNLRAELVGAPENCEVVWNEQGDGLILADLPGYATKTAVFTVIGTVPTEGRNYQQFKVKITSDEGVELLIPAHFHAKPRYALLNLQPKSLDVTMQLDPQNQRGTPRHLEVELSNDGAAPTGKITISLPSLSWMKLVGERELASLEPGQSTSFLLTLTADGNTPLNAPLSGSIAINAPQAYAGVTLPFRATAVADGTGSLTVDAIDDYTYYEPHAPHLEGALVIVRNPYTSAELARGTTLADGKVTLENLPIGPCRVIVRKEKHAEYSNIVEIQPGRTTPLEAFLDYQAITYSWDVVRVEIEDRYEVELTVIYETNVPMPVVETIMPSRMPFLRPGETHMFSAVLTNKGLIRADDVNFAMPEVFNSQQCAMTFQYPQGTYSLLPQQSVTIPVVATGIEPTRSDECVGYEITLWSWECGMDRKWHQVRKVFSVEGTYCGYGYGYGFYDGPAQLIASMPGSSSYVSEPPVPTVPSQSEGCVPCTVGLTINVMKCFVSFIPVFGCYAGLADCAYSLRNAYNTGGAYAWGTSGLGCALGVAGCFHWTASVVNCVLLLYTACDDAMVPPPGGGPPGNGSGGSSGSFGDDDSGGSSGGFRGVDMTRSTRASNKPEWLAIAQEKLAVAVAHADLVAAYSREIYGAPCWEEAESDAVLAFYNAFLALALPNGSAANVSDAQRASLVPLLPQEVEPDDLKIFVDRWNRSVAYWETCSLKNVPDYPEGANPEDYIRLHKLFDLSDQMEECEAEAVALGYESVEDLYTRVTEDIRIGAQGSSSVCAQVTMKITQTVSLTREAFEGTLTLFNGHENKNMTNVKLQLVVTDALGKDCTDLFDISELAERFVELSAIDGSGTLAPKTTGSAVVRFIPENEAATSTSKKYFFGGILSYTNPFSDETATIELTPVPLEVFPGPRLQMHYFLQRDILGDDPLTEEIIEPSYPAELSVLVYNAGFGQAKNFRIDSGQPEITQNDKGLLIDFALWDHDLMTSTLNGQPNTAPLGQVNLGNIPAGSHGLAQWWLTASLQGHFIGMSATYTHLTSNGNPDICLIDSVDIHELHRSGEDLAGNQAFLVNDEPDLWDTPDTLWIARDYASGTAPIPVEVYDTCQTTAVAFFAGSEEPPLPATLTFKVTPDSGAAWFYLNLLENQLGDYKILRTTRDGEEIPFRNCWLTDRTMPDGRDPIYENRVHLYDYFPTGAAQTYVVELERLPEVSLEIVSFGGVDSYVIPTALSHIDVFFSDRIRLSTFTVADLTLRYQGTLLTEQQLSALTITTVLEDDSNQIYQYRIGNLGALTMADGFYVLTVQAAGISNWQGAAGQVGRQLNWIKSTAAYQGATISEMRRVVTSGMLDGEYWLELDFLGAVLPDTVTTAGLTLTRDGTPLPLAGNVVVQPGELTGQFYVLNLSQHTFADGVYRLRFDAAASGVQDEDGNDSAASKEITWTIDTTPPGDIDDLHIEVDDGISAEDGITWGRSKTLVGTLPEGGLLVEVYFRMTGAGTNSLLTSKQYGAEVTNMALAINLPADGAVTLTVRLIDAAGNANEQDLQIFIDTIPLSAQILELPDVSPEQSRLRFSVPILDAAVLKSALHMTVNGSAVGVDLSELEIVPVPGGDGREYFLLGLNNCSVVSGQHALRLDLSKLQKQLSGLPGAGTHTATWKMLYPLTAAQKLALATAVNSGWAGFDSGGDAYWQVDDQVYADDPQAPVKQSLRSGAIGRGEESVLSMVVLGPGVLRFSWKVSSAANQDLLSFAINGQAHAVISGVDGDWATVEVPITGIGEQELTWTYSRGHTAAAGENCGWVDLIAYQKYCDVQFAAASKTYDATTDAARLGDFVLHGVLPGHEVMVNDDAATYSFATPQQGADKTVTATEVVLLGAEAFLYKMRLATARANIAAKAVEINFAALDKVYDGTTGAAIDLASIDFGGQLEGEDTLAVTAAVGAFAEAKVGDWPVTVNVADCVIAGNDAGNYTLAFADGAQAQITPRPVVVSFVAEDKVYDGNLEATVGGFAFANVVAGEELAIADVVAEFAERRVGVWEVTINDGFTVTGNDEGNYTLGFAPATANITPRLTTVSFVADDKVYDSTKSAAVHDFAFADLVAGDGLAIADVVATFADSDVGTWRVTVAEGYAVTGNDEGNYTLGFAEVQARITAKAVVVGFAALDKVYDGTTDAAIDLASIDFGDQLAGEDALAVTAAVGAFAEAKVGDWPVTVNVADCVIAGNDAGNYTLAFAGGAQAQITPRPVVLSFVAEDKVYDGNLEATVGGFVFANVVAGEELAIADVVATFAERRVGAWEVTINDGFTVTGNDEGNYTLGFATTTANITPRLTTVSFVADDKVYDSTKSAVVHDFAFADLVAGDGLAIADVVATFAGSDVGTWRVTVADGYTVTGNDEGNYTLRFAEVQAMITHNVQVVNPGWNLVVLQLTELASESLAVWDALGAMILLNGTLQRKHAEVGEVYWLFNRQNEPLELKGLKQFPISGWNAPDNKQTWILAGPERADFVIPAGMVVWQWEDSKFVLLAPGEKLPAGNAAWIWQY